jgi:hypothetical protein
MEAMAKHKEENVNMPGWLFRCGKMGADKKWFTYIDEEAGAADNG